MEFHHDTVTYSGENVHKSMDLKFCGKCSKQMDGELRGGWDMDPGSRKHCMSRYKMCSNYHLVFTIFIFILLTSNICDGFNIDTTSTAEFEGPNKDSYFGYSLAMLNQGSRNKWLLLGAPRDKSAFLPEAKRPGTIYKYTFTESGHVREELFIDDNNGDDAVDFNGTTRIFKHGHDDQWLGASMDVNRKAGIVTCASRWFNKYFEDKKDSYYMNGLCYELPLDLNRNNIEKIPALVDGKMQIMELAQNQKKFHYGMGSLGASAHYSKEGEDLLLGTPGLHTWSGGFVDLRGTKSYILRYNEPPTENSEMAGYAMTSGNYFGSRYFAIGATRQDLVGKVFLFSAGHTNYISENADLTLDGSDLIEIPINGYFGAALCSEDINGDGLDDLLVAAPFYSSGLKEDTGIVLVYFGDREKKTFRPQSSMLRGDDVAGARFGSSMSSLGDINKDGYNDVVIGAPYEANGRGAIYVYNGCTTGLWPKHSQKITAASISPDLMSFGIAFSKAEDMNDDDHNDIAVGAYLSDKAYLFYGQYVISIDMTVKSSVEQIDKDNSEECTSLDGQSKVPCFRVQVCFSYEEREYGQLDVDLELKLDTYVGEYNRIMFSSNGKNVLSEKLRIFSSSTICSGWREVLIKSTSDLVTPVRIEASYDVPDILSAGGIKPTINKFDGKNPTHQLLVSTALLEFKKDCPNNDCQTDLHLSALAEYDHSNNDHYIIGSAPLALDITISKSGHPSYSSNFFVAFPNVLQFQKVTKVYGDPEISCGFVTNHTVEGSDEDHDTQTLDYRLRQNIPPKSEDESLMMCSFGNPLYNDTGVRSKLHLYVPLSVNSTSLTFRLNATTLSSELVPADNVQSMKVSVRNKVSTSFVGVSRPSYTTMRNKTKSYTVSHTYELKNKGPSPLPASSLMIQYPQIQKRGRPLLFLNLTSWSCPPPCHITCSFPDSDNTAPVVHASHIGPTYVVTQDEDKDVGKTGESRTISDMVNIDCLKSECSRYECMMYNIPASESAVVTLDYVVKGDILEVIADGDAITATSKAYVTLKQLQRLIYDSREHYTSVGTDLLPVTPPSQKVAWWIYLVSILGGIILIAIVVVLLWKCGFFRRKRLEDLKAMQHTAEVEKMIPDEEEANDVKKSMP